MIIILFISICIAWYFYQYFENKRNDRMEKKLKKRRDAYEQLLKILRDKENNNNTHIQPAEQYATGFYKI